MPYIFDDGFGNGFPYFGLAAFGAEEVSLEFEDGVCVGDGVDVEMRELWVGRETAIRELRCCRCIFCFLLTYVWLTE